MSWAQTFRGPAVKTYFSRLDYIERLESVLCGQAFVLGQRIAAHERYLDAAVDERNAASYFDWSTDREFQRQAMAVGVLRVWAEELGL